MRRTLVLAALSAAIAAPAPAAAHHRGCNTKACHDRVVAKTMRKAIAPHRWFLAKLRACEWDPRPQQRWRTDTGNGFYGAYQFTLSSWRTVGGRGMPHHASPLEQSYRAVLLLQRQGPGAWPVCSR